MTDHRPVRYTPLSVFVALLMLLPAVAAAGTSTELAVGPGEAYTEIQAAVNDASSGATITVAGGEYTENVVIDGKALTLQAAGGANVVIKPATGTALTLESNFGPESVVIIDGITFQGGTTGVQVADGVVLGELVLSNATFIDNQRWGVMVGDGDYDSGAATSLGKLTVSQGTFTMSGATHPMDQGAGIKLWRFQGDASISDSTFTGGADAESPSPANAIEMQGVDNENLVDVAIGNVTLANVTVTGHYTKNPVGVYNYTDTEGLAINGLDLSGATSDWYLFNIDGAKLVLDASGYDITWPEGHLPVAELQGEKQGTDGTMIIGSAANEILNGKGSGDMLEGGAGNDLLVGGEGNDFARFSGNRADYLIGIDRINSVDGDSPVVFWTIVDQRDGAPDGVDKLLDVEALEFGDGTEIVTLSDLDETGLFIVDAEGQGDIDSLQAALDAAHDGDTILVRPGVYEELKEDFRGSSIGLAIEKSVKIYGVTADSQLITDAADVQATIISGKESPWGANFLVSAPNVNIRGLRFEARADSSDPASPEHAVNKAFEIEAGGFELSNSVVAAAEGFDFSGKTSTAVYFGDAGEDDLESFLVVGNVLGGGITITNGAGDSVEPALYIVGNTVSGTHFLRIRGVVDDIAWLTKPAGVPIVSGNDLTAVTDVLVQSWDEEKTRLVDLAFVEALGENNVTGPYAYLLDADGNIGTMEYTEYTGTALAVFVYRTAEDFGPIPPDYDVQEGDTLDQDGDDIPDVEDDDVDGDGIDNIDEGGGDADGDGIPNYKDNDSDGDGIPDATEGLTDLDGDGVPDYLDITVDEDEDGIPDVVEGSTDPDGDTTPNRLDTDSDNDGVPDAIELADLTKDGDGDGIADFFDVDVTGGFDANGDGIDDAPVKDADIDGRSNLVDPDQDGDGVPDFVEVSVIAKEEGMGKTAAPAAMKPEDTDIRVVDSDADGIPNVRDLDSDRDGVSDSVEAGALDKDSDGDGIDDAFDVDQLGGTDDDGNGIPDDVVVQDSDGDGATDYIDLDSDNDGIADVVEAGGADSDGDGLLDEGGEIVTTVRDTDDDGTPDHLDLDSDGDGTFDIEGTAAGKWDEDGDGRIDVDAATDDDGDGIADVIDGEAGQHGSRIDTDGDGVAAHIDADDDNDGIADVTEGKDDTDDDGAIDRLDRDSDDDGLVDRIESGRSAPAGDDANGNGIDDAYDAAATGGKDADADGIDDKFELRDTDGDETPDHLDADSDDDSLSDAYEVGLKKLSGADTDGDGIDDAIDVDKTGGADVNKDGVDDGALKVEDTDDDGLENHRDADSDGDGIKDGKEDRDSDGDGINDRLQEGPNEQPDPDDDTDPDTQPDSPVGGGGGGGSTGWFLAALLGLMAARRQARLAA